MTDKIIVGEIDWMRNDYLSDITVGGITYPSVEHAYQAAKFSDTSVREEIADADDVRAARKLGREMPGIDPNWDVRKSTVMEQLVRAKFTQDTVLGERLAKTGSAAIIMEGYDSFWGTGRDGDGDNQLGEILETVRSEIQFITGINPSDYDESEDEDDREDGPPSLKEALENNPDDDLLSACQDLYDGTRALMTLIDTNDYDADFICRRTGVSRLIAENAIRKLQKMQGALSKLNDLLKEEDEDDGDDEGIPDGHYTWKGAAPKPGDPTPQLRNDPVQIISPEEDDEDHPDDDWLSSFD